MFRNIMYTGISRSITSLRLQGPPHIQSALHPRRPCHSSTSTMTFPTSSPHQTIKTRFLIISDTHSAQLSSQENEPQASTPFPFRKSLPSADVLLHCGDLTKIGQLYEYRKTLDMLGECDAEFKLVIAGNHDISLDEEYYQREGMRMHRHTFDPKMPKEAKEMWTGEEARKAGVTYLEEGSHTFVLKSGAKLRVCFRNICDPSSSSFLQL